MTTSTRLRPETAIDLSDAGIWHGGVPHSEFSRLRKESPVAWNERHDGHRGFWAVCGYDEIVKVGRDTQTFSSRNGVISLDDFDDAQNDARRTLLEMDPPQHSIMRKVSSSAFGPSAIARLESDIRERTGLLLDEYVGAGEIEVVSLLSKRIPILTLCRLLGVPDSYQHDMIRWSDLLIGSDDPDFDDPQYADVPDEQRKLLPFGHPASLDAFALGRELRAARLADPQDDVITVLAQATVDDRPLSDSEFLNYYLMLVVAGNETTRHTMTHMLIALADHPEEWDRFRAGGINPRVAVNEALRWATPVHFVRRIATCDTKLGGASISKGDKVAMYFVSGNRDETQFDGPDRFIIDRARNPHMAFGSGGPHFCLGNFVAQLQLRILLEEMASRVRRIELAGAADRLRSNHVNAIKSQHLVLI